MWTFELASIVMSVQKGRKRPAHEGEHGPHFGMRGPLSVRYLHLCARGGTDVQRSTIPPCSSLGIVWSSGVALQSTR